jgi:hypothetical protein
MEMLNRYIGGGRKRDQTTDLRGIEHSLRGIRSRRAWKPRESLEHSAKLPIPTSSFRKSSKTFKLRSLNSRKLRLI